LEECALLNGVASGRVKKPQQRVSARKPGRQHCRGLSPARCARRDLAWSTGGVGQMPGEQVNNLSGKLQRNITRVYDAMNRVQKKSPAQAIENYPMQ
jgi:hypothetical protein